MAGPAGKKGMARVRFGKTGRPVNIPTKTMADARRSGGTVYEDGSVSRGAGRNPTPRPKAMNAPTSSVSRRLRAPMPPPTPTRPRKRGASGSRGGKML